MKLKTPRYALPTAAVCTSHKQTVVIRIFKNRCGLKKLFTILLCTIAITTYGQKNILDIGAEGGFSIASLRGNENEFTDQNTRIGDMAGLFVQYNFKKNISVRTGAYYEQKGSAGSARRVEDQYGALYENVPFKVNLDYLAVPLLIRATFGKKINYFINAGPYIGFLVKSTIHNDAFQSLPEVNTDVKDNYKKTETGLSAGVGVSYNIMQKLGVSFEVRDNLGLSNTSAVTIYNNGVIKTNALNFLLGVGYKL